MPALAVIAMIVAGVFAAGPSAASSSGGAASASEVAATVSSGRVVTADLSKFQPGNIISDAVFFDSGTMTESQIQQFLEAKVPRCQSGYTCLRDWYDTSRATATDAMCRAYPGGMRERASTIIYKVAQACGINPRVLIVMLQKEQGLVTHVWPSEWRYTAAMGQGCPDTAACDARYYGFFNQVYGAAWQLKRYANPPGTSQYFTWYAPGRTWNVRWHPNAGCGSSPVYIQNQSTANLYYYTPYQPNAAALRAGYGEGDGCSSYGNRNFYQYFTDWFGSTQQGDGGAIQSAYVALGGQGGFLGAPLMPVRCGLSAGGCYQDFAGGVIYWTSSTGAWALSGSVRSVWAGNDYERGLGYPTAPQVCGQINGGCHQDFQNGVIYLSPSGTYALTGAIRQKWVALDYERGLGYPSGTQTCPAGGLCYQDFQNGVIYSSTSGAYAIKGAIRQTWNSLDYERGLGVPTRDERCLPDGGCYQDFREGVVYSSKLGAFAIAGPIRDVWNASDYERGLGYPASPKKCISTDTCYQEFQRGAIYSSPLGTYSIVEPFRTVWNGLDFERGLGVPAGGVRCLPDGACYQDFQSGVIYRSTAGVFGISGAIRQKWVDLDYERGLGYPTGAMACSTAGCSQAFQRGTITWTAQAGATVSQR